MANLYHYQKYDRYFAQVADEIKDLAEQELQNLGATKVQPAYRGLYFESTKDILYTIVYNSQLLNRVLAPIILFDCHSDKYLYKTAKEIPWSDFLSSHNTFAVFSSVANSNITHSHYASLRLKDAISDYFRDKTGKRPSVDTRQPDVWINLHIENNKATISIDASGGALHRRGYRKKQVEAPMIETLAAAIIHMAEWDQQTFLVDPFCGSGTLLTEAYIYSTKTPPAYLRKNFGFTFLPDFNKKMWNKIKMERDTNIQSIKQGIISGSDIDPHAIAAAKMNAELVCKNDEITFSIKNVFDIDDMKEKTIIANPPYGIRLNAIDDLSDFYKQFGDFLKQKCTNSRAYIYFGERKYIKNIGLRPTWKKPLRNGGLDGRLVKYELY